MAPKKLQSLLFFAEKAIFSTWLTSVAETTIFHLGSRNFVCTISIHIPTHSKKTFLLQQTQEGGNINLKSVLFSAGCTFFQISRKFFLRPQQNDNTDKTQKQFVETVKSIKLYIRNVTFTVFNVYNGLLCFFLMDLKLTYSKI